jgi:hypothetical protein
MKIEEVLHLFTPISEGLPEPGWHLIVNHNGRASMDRLNKKGKWQLTNPTHYLDLSKLTTKERAIQLANNIGCEVLADRALGKKITSTNDVGQLVIKNKHNL